ncbi:hypothetical protein [Proteus vulgaris]|uniref:hypothetical protein n=1 Tax=Proteus vulgaris TaxID=585 RepID=UPI0021A793D2|nr:hypothetical protein [Proteus vulgaris]
MTIKTNLFKPGVLFLNKTHYLPKTEIYTVAKSVVNIKNKPVSPSFAKKFIHGVISLFHRLEICFLIRGIKNNKLVDVVDINKHSNVFNEIDIKINRIKKEIEIEKNESKKLYNSLNVDSEYVDNFTKNKITKKNIEIKSLIEESKKIKNKNLYFINNIIYHANDKFDFYNLCDYLTEVKRAKDFFSVQDDIEREGSDSKLIVDFLNEVIKNRISSLDETSIKNIIKLIFLKFKFENIHLNEKYDFMHNFSKEKERDNFIKTINFLLISIDEYQVLSKFNDNIKNKIENRLSTIMMIALNKIYDSEDSFDSLKQEWGEKYIDNNYNTIKRNSVIDNNIEIETIIDIPKSLSKEDLNNKYIDIDNFKVNEFELKLRDEKNSIKEVDEGDDIDLQWDDEFINVSNTINNEELQQKLQREYNEEEEQINIFFNNVVKQSNLESEEKFNKIKNKLELIILDIGELSTEENSPLNLDKELKFSPDKYQLDFDTKEITSEISEEDKSNKKL